MDTFIGHSPQGTGLATVAVLGALLDTLIVKGVLQRNDAVKVLDDARAALSPSQHIISAQDALDIIGKLSKGLQ
jgi:hypothetical protein